MPACRCGSARWRSCSPSRRRSCRTGSSRRRCAATASAGRQRGWGDGCSGRRPRACAGVAAVVASVLLLGGTSAAIAAAPEVSSGQAAVLAGMDAVQDAPVCVCSRSRSVGFALFDSRRPVPSPTPVAGTDVSAIGDSVMLASAPALLEELPGNPGGRGGVALHVRRARHPAESGCERSAAAVRGDRARNERPAQRGRDGADGADRRAGPAARAGRRVRAPRLDPGGQRRPRGVRRRAPGCRGRRLVGSDRRAHRPARGRPDPPGRRRRRIYADAVAAGVAAAERERAYAEYDRDLRAYRRLHHAELQVAQ